MNTGKFWYSPFIINKYLIKKLSTRNIKQINSKKDFNNCILIYSSPDRIIENLQTQNFKNNINYIDFIKNGYLEILNYSKIENNLIIPDWHLNSSNLLDSICKEELFLNIEIDDKNVSIPQVSIIAALIAKEILIDNQDIIDMYLDIELIANLFGRNIDLEYKDKIFNFFKDKNLLIDSWLSINQNIVDINKRLINSEQIIKQKNTYLDKLSKDKKMLNDKLNICNRSCQSIKLKKK